MDVTTVNISPARKLASIVIPCHNHGRYLNEAIESALTQTYRPIEVIVVDDGSTDNSAEVAGRYPVTLVTQKNQGAGAALNHGIRVARGQYLVRLDADDKLHPAFVERCIQVLEEHAEPAFVYTWVILFGARDGIFLSKPYDLCRLKLGNYIPGAAVIRREAIRAVGGFDTSLTWLEDWDLWLSLAEKSLFGRLLPELLLYYRQHEGGGRNAPSPRIARATVRRIMLKHPRLFPRFYLVMDTLEKAAETVLPSFIKRKLRRASPRTYSTWSVP
jgi:glycosyltransferase involved in cell wall biosynthesis